MPIRNIALVEEKSGSMSVHRAECAEARQAAADGRPVLTMLGIQRMPFRRDLGHWHSCMDSAPDE